MSGERTSVAVVGGGIAGLALGFHLMKLGMAVRVLEAAPRPGGNIRTESHHGYRCEWGPNGFLDNEPATLRLVDALGLVDELVPSSDAARVRWIVRGGRLRELPTRPSQFLWSDVLSPGGRMRVLLEPMQPARRDSTDESVLDFARRRLGREAAEVLVDAMVTGIYAGDSSRLSLEATFPRLRRMEQDHGSLFAAMVAAGKARKRNARSSDTRPHVGAGPFGPGGVLTSFGGGMETLVRALAETLEAALVCEARVLRVERGSNSWRLEVEGAAPLEAEQLVLACPAWHAAPLLRSLDADLSELVRGIPAAPVAVVCFGFAASDVAATRRGFGFLVPAREKLDILGTLFDSWVFPRRAVEGTVLWRTIVGGAHDPAAVDLDDDALAGRVQRALEKILGQRAAPVMTHIVRHRRGIPQYSLGHLQRLSRIEASLARHPGLHLTGNSYRGVAMNACIREAEALALHLAGAPLESDST